MTDISVYTIYGVRVQDDARWQDLEEDPGQCDNTGTVGYFTAGRYDNDMTFLATQWMELTPGQYKLCMVDPEVEDPRAELWDALLLQSAARLGLRVLDGPGWYTIADES